MKIYLLGSFRAATSAGSDIAFATKSTAAVLALLALRPGRRYSRAALAQLLWPDGDPERAASNVRQTLWRLRQAVGADGTALHITRGDVWLEPSPELWTDLGAFLETGDPDLIQGALLEGWEDEWVSVAREELQDRLLSRLAEGAAAALQAGRPRDTLRLGRHLVALDPLREDGHRLLIAAHLALGDAAAALQQYRACQKALADDLGVAPSSETQALAAEARAGSATAAGARGLIGREAELARIAKAVLTGRPEQVLLLGEPGIGKSRLLEGATATAREAGLRVLATACHDGPAPPPYQLLTDLLRSAGTQFLRGLAPGVTAALSLILPELGTATRTSPGEDRHRLIAAVGEALQALAGRGPLVITLEDIHWSDPASVAALELLLPRLGHVRLIATSRLDPLAERDDLRDWADRQEAAGRLLALNLAPLTAVDTAQLAAQLEPEFSPLYLSWLHQETGGNPLFVIELVRAARHQPVAPPAELPPGIQRVMRSRLHGVPEEGRTLLRAGAVLGLRFGINELRLLLGLPDEELVAGIEDLLMRGLLVEDGAGCRFYHARFREAVLADLTLARRQTLHRKAAHVVRGAAAAGYHAEAGGDWPLAAAKLLEAGREAMALGELSAAADLFGRAAAAARQMPEGEAQTAAAMLLQERALSLLPSPDQQRALLDRLDQMAAARGDRALAVQVASRRSMLLSRSGRLAEADAEAARAVRLAEAGGVPLDQVVEAQLQMAHNDWVSGRQRRSLALSQAALEGARRAGSLFWEGRCLRRLAESYSVRAAYGKSYEMASGALEIARRLGDLSLQIAAERHIATYLMFCGEYDRAMQMMQEQVGLTQRLGYRSAEGYANMMLSLICRTRGDDAAGGAYAAECMRLAATLSEPKLTEWAYREVAAHLLNTGRFAEAIATAEQGLAVSQAAPDRHRLEAFRARAWLELGRADEAAAWARQQHPVVPGRSPNVSLEVATLAAAIWQATGNDQQAARWRRWADRLRRLIRPAPG